MSLSVISTGAGYPVGGYSLPDMVSFCVNDGDGTGGSVYINGLGILTGDFSGAYDLKTLFTSANKLFTSIPLLRAFRQIFSGTNQATQNQLVQNSEISSYPVNANFPAFPLRFAQLYQSINGIGVPFWQIIAPDGGEGYTGDTWRVEIKLRHSLTN